MMEAFGQSNYQKSDAVYRDRPVKEFGPNCRASFLFKRTSKRGGTVRYCQNEDCDYKLAVDNTNLTSKNTAEEKVSV